MKKALLAAVASLVLPAAVQAQSMFTPGPSNPGFYVGIEGGGNWLLNSSNYNMDIGYAAGGVMGYDFVGPRLELEGVFRSNNGRGTANFGNVFSNVNGRIEQLSVMANLLYDFMPGAIITPYVGAGAGIGLIGRPKRQDLCVRGGDVAVRAEVVRRPSRSSPEWSARTLNSGADVRDFAAVRAAVAVDIPFTAKMRLGIDDDALARVVELEAVGCCNAHVQLLRAQSTRSVEETGAFVFTLAWRRAVRPACAAMPTPTTAAAVAPMRFAVASAPNCGNPVPPPLPT